MARGSILVALTLLLVPATAAAARDVPPWVGPMKEVHAKFKGEAGSLALFGDSITVSQAFWTPLAYGPKNLSPEGTAALDLVKKHMQERCWREWRGPEFGNDGGQTIAWAAEHVDQWLKDLNPETVVLMFGTNDVAGGVTVEAFAKTTRGVVQKCLDNGSVVILTTIPPRSGGVEQTERFAAAAREIAKDMDLPLIDYHAEVLRRRPDDWDGAQPAFKDEAGGDVYNVTTLISGDGVHPSAPAKYADDFSDEALSRHGYNLRSHLTLLAYADVIGRVLAP